MESPHGLATDGAGHVFVSEQGGQAVRQFMLATGKLNTLAGRRDGFVGYE